MSEKKSVQANDRNYSSVPSTYVFKKRGTIRGDNQTKLPSSRVLSIRPNSDDAPVKNRPPQTYQFRRLQIDRYDDNDNVILNKQLSSDSTGVPTDKRILQRIRFP